MTRTQFDDDETLAQFAERLRQAAHTSHRPSDRLRRVLAGEVTPSFTQEIIMATDNPGSRGRLARLTARLARMTLLAKLALGAGVAAAAAGGVATTVALTDDGPTPVIGEADATETESDGVLEDRVNDDANDDVDDGNVDDNVDDNDDGQVDDDDDGQVGHQDEQEGDIDDGEADDEDEGDVEDANDGVSEDSDDADLDDGDDEEDSDD